MTKQGKETGFKIAALICTVLMILGAVMAVWGSTCSQNTRQDEQIAVNRVAISKNEQRIEALYEKVGSVKEDTAAIKEKLGIAK